MRATDSLNVANATTSSASKVLSGGSYSFAASFANPSALSAQVQQLLPDGVTFLPIGSAAAHANGIQTLSLPPGTYQIKISGTPGAGETVSASLCRVPND
jgi:hypothetical protein